MNGQRVVVTGVGIVSCLGNSFAEVAASLRDGRVGVVSIPEWIELGLSSTVAAPVAGASVLRTDCGFAKDQTLCMPDAALYCAIAARDAIHDAGLTPADLSSRTTGCIVGSGVSGTMAVYAGGRKLFDGNPGG